MPCIYARLLFLLVSTGFLYLSNFFSFDLLLSLILLVTISKAEKSFLGSITQWWTSPSVSQRRERPLNMNSQLFCHSSAYLSLPNFSHSPRTHPSFFFFSLIALVSVLSPLLLYSDDRYVHGSSS